MVPPSVKFLTTGNGKVAMNPNLYEDGTVCLSLLGTWEGPAWEPKKSTLLQVLVSIQGLVLVAEPYFNEPGYEDDRGSPDVETESAEYTQEIRRYTLQYAIDEPLRIAASSNATNYSDYPEFTEAIIRHFSLQAPALEAQLDAWTTADTTLNTLAVSIRESLAIVVKIYEAQAPSVRCSSRPATFPVTAEAVILEENKPSKTPRLVSDC
jgi:Ubiquitin-conjugating enzyme